MKRTTVIYGLYDPITKQVRYVGKTVSGLRRRLDAHLYNARHRLKQPCAHWVGSLLARGLHPEIFEIEVCPPGADWEEAERFWIESLRALGCRLLNLSVGGGAGALGWRASDDTKRKMSTSRMGRVVTEETRKKIGASNRGKVRSPEVCRKNVRRGEKSSKAKVAALDVPKIRALMAAGYSGTQAGTAFGITKQAADAIFKRESWSHIPDEVADISGISVSPIHRLRGEAIGNAKLDADAVRDIRARLVGKRGTRETGRALALEYGVTATTISDVRKRRIWRHID